MEWTPSAQTNLYGGEGGTYAVGGLARVHEKTKQPLHLLPTESITSITIIPDHQMKPIIIN